MSQPEVVARAEPVAGVRRFPFLNGLLLATTALTTAMASTSAAIRLPGRPVSAWP